MDGTDGLPADLPRRLGDELSAASSSFKAAAADGMRSLGVHSGQNFLLAELRAEQPLTTGELARRLRVDEPTAVRTIHRMQAAGLLHRRADPEDHRRVLVELTPAGGHAAEQVPLLLDTVGERALAGLDEAERRSLVDLLHRVATNLGRPAPHDDHSAPSRD